jgi:hypothetical protein
MVDMNQIDQATKGMSITLLLEPILSYVYNKGSVTGLTQRI